MDLVDLHKLSLVQSKTLKVAMKLKHNAEDNYSREAAAKELMEIILDINEQISLEVQMNFQQKK